MVVSLANIPKNSQVFRFITAGKRGRCNLCYTLVEKLEAHHVCYSPEITIKICHNCHHKVHFWPNRLSEEEKLKLLTLRFSLTEAQKFLKESLLGPAALAKLIAPSRNAFIHAVQRIEARKLSHSKKQNEKSPHSSRVLNVNKSVNLKKSR